MEEIQLHPIYKGLPIQVDEEAKICYVPLTNKYQEQVGVAIIDIDDMHKVLKNRFHMAVAEHQTKTNYYAITSNGESLHDMVNGVPPEGYTNDHINNDGLDNRKVNLYHATNSQQSQNREKVPGCLSKYSGVTKIAGKWVATIQKEYKVTRLGRYEIEEDAGKIYDIYAFHLYGKHCRNNGLLTEAEIQDVLTNGIPEQYQLKEREYKTLVVPNIRYRYNKYNLTIMRNGKTLDKTFKTLEEAEEAKAVFLAEHEKKVEEKENKRKKNITRNKFGQAVIYGYRKGKIYEAIVDDHIWADVSTYRWSVTRQGYFQTATRRNFTLLHRYIYKKYVLMGKPIPEGKTIDHKISDRKDDNRLANLRPASGSLQSHNKHKLNTKIDKYKGVSFGRKYFNVDISGKRYGSFKTAEAAATRANEVFREIYGEDAYQNKIDYSVTTTAENRIPANIITKEFVENIKHAKDLINVIRVKKLGVRAGGSIYIHEINAKNLETGKKQVIAALFSNDKEEIQSEMVEVEMVEVEMEGEEVEMEEVDEIEESDTEEDEIEEYYANDDMEEIQEDHEIAKSESEENENEEEEEEEENITEKFVKSIKTIKELLAVIRSKNLGIRAGGPIHIKDVKAKDLEKYKLKVIDLLFSKGKEEDEDEVEEE